MRAPFQVLVIPWRRRGAMLEVAVLHRSDYDVWQFVSGGGEEGETPLEAARREGLEEAAIPTSAAYLALDATASLPACWFAAWPDWPARVLVVPEHAFAVEVADIVRSDEHRDLRWCSVDEAMPLLRFDSNRHALWELHERLFPGPRIKRRAYP
jgi:dihydroneopterin triphosphate diphosphatase